jgi:hypothetical protein
LWCRHRQFRQFRQSSLSLPGHPTASNRKSCLSQGICSTAISAGRLLKLLIRCFTTPVWSSGASPPPLSPTLLALGVIGRVTPFLCTLLWINSTKIDMNFIKRVSLKTEHHNPLFVHFRFKPPPYRKSTSTPSLSLLLSLLITYLGRPPLPPCRHHPLPSTRPPAPQASHTYIL